jgi:hypothetical protein
MIEAAVKSDRMFRRLMPTFFTAHFNNKITALTKLANSVYRKSLTITTHQNDLIGYCDGLDALPRRHFIATDIAAYPIRHGI